MSAWVNIPASVSLLSEINAVGEPGRVKAQDGTVGDVAHAAGGTSDHLPDEDFSALKGKDSDKTNEVHARDADSRGPWLPGWSMERIVQTVVARVRAGVEKRIRYVIYRRRIWHWVDGEFVQSVYTGDDPHELHAHFSFNYGSGASNPEDITAPWGILAAYEAEQSMAIEAADIRSIWTTDGIVGTPSNASDFSTNPQRTPAQSLTNIEYHVRAAEANVEAMSATIAALAAADHVDEVALANALAPAVAAAVLAALPSGVDISTEQLTEAVFAAIKQLAAPATPAA